MDYLPDLLTQCCRIADENKVMGNHKVYQKIELSDSGLNM